MAQVMPLPMPQMPMQPMNNMRNRWAGRASAGIGTMQRGMATMGATIRKRLMSNRPTLVMLTLAFFALLSVIVLIWAADYTEGVKVYFTLVNLVTMCICLFCLVRSIQRFRNQKRRQLERQIETQKKNFELQEARAKTNVAEAQARANAAVEANNSKQNPSDSLQEVVKVIKQGFDDIRRDISKIQSPAPSPAPPSRGVDPPSNLPSPDLRHMIERASCDDNALYRFTPPPPIQLPPES